LRLPTENSIENKKYIFNILKTLLETICDDCDFLFPIWPALKRPFDFKTKKPHRMNMFQANAIQQQQKIEARYRLGKNRICN
jgi:hypothetical protein